MKRILLIFVILAAAVIAWRYFSAEEAAPEMKKRRTTAVADVMDIVEKVETTGITTPMLETDVRSEINGKIEHIFVEEGDRVAKDQPLIELDTRSIKAELDEAKRRHEAQLLRLNKAQRDYNRLEKLASKNYAQESEFLDAKTDLELAQLELEIQSARLESALDKQDKSVVTAPHDGTIINLDVNEGQVITGANSVSNGTTLMQVADITRLEIEINLNEVDINKVKLGDQAKLTFDAIEGEFYSGSITEIAPNAVTTSNTQTFSITISLDGNDPRIRPGLSTKIELPVARVEQVVGVNVAAVFFEEEIEDAPPRRYVFVDNGDGSFTEKTVLTGINDKMHVEILEGLEPGDRVSLERPAITSQTP